MAGPVEQRRDRVPQSGAAAVPHVQRARRIGGDEFDVDPLPAAHVAAAVALARSQHGRQHGGELRFGEEEIDEPGPGDFDLLDEARRQLQRPHQLLGDGARRLSLNPRDHQRQVRGAVTVRGVPGRFVLELRQRRHADRVRRVT